MLKLTEGFHKAPRECEVLLLKPVTHGENSCLKLGFGQRWTSSRQSTLVLEALGIMQASEVMFMVTSGSESSSKWMTCNVLG